MDAVEDEKRHGVQQQAHFLAGGGGPQDVDDDTKLKASTEEDAGKS